MKTTIGKEAILFILALCGVWTLAAEPVGRHGPGSSPQVGANETYLLGLPRDGRPMVVRTAFHLQDIDEIDDERETVEFTGVLILTWRDKRQAFNPDEARVDEKIYQGAFQFNELSPAWYPQVVLANESGLYEKHATLLRVKPDGTSKLVETVNAIAKSNLNLRRYPFDTQRLEAIFEVLGFDTGEVVLQAEPLPARSDEREIRMPGWKLTGIGASAREKAAPHAGKRGVSSTFVLDMEVKRQSMFMLRLVVLPLFLIVVLSWSVFWMDRSALGDRINVSFVGILTAVAYQMAVGDILPEISYMTLMNSFLNISFWVMCVTVVIHLIVDIKDRQGDSASGDLIDRRCRWIFPLVYFGSLSVVVAIVFIFF
ncbi:MAG: hypothetical protein ACRERU_20020 [Methylococcales bacterium]